MNIKEFYISIFLLLILLNGCKQSSSDTNQEGALIRITIEDPEKENDILYLSHYFKEAQVVPLETKAECLLGEIKKIEMDDNLLFVQDYTGKGIYCFNMEGKFLHHIGTLGNGPDELPDIKSFAIDKEENVIYLHSRILELNRSYSYKGEVIGEIPCGYLANEMSFMAGNLYLSHPNGNINSHNLVGVNAVGKIVEKHEPVEPDGVSTIPILRKNNGKIYYYSNLLRDTVYALDGKGAYEPALIFNCPKYRIPYEVRKRMYNMKTKSPTDWMEIGQNRYTYLNDYAIFPNFTYFCYCFGVEVYEGFYDEKTKKSASTYDICDDISYLALGDVKGQTDNQLITVLSTQNISSSTEEYYQIVKFTDEQIAAEKAKIKRLEEYMDKEEDPNPFVVIYTIK